MQYTFSTTICPSCQNDLTKPRSVRCDTGNRAGYRTRLQATGLEGCLVKNWPIEEGLSEVACDSCSASLADLDASDWESEDDGDGDVLDQQQKS